MVALKGTKKKLFLGGHNTKTFTLPQLRKVIVKGHYPIKLVEESRPGNHRIIGKEAVFIYNLLEMANTNSFVSRNLNRDRSS